jgi:integrase
MARPRIDREYHIFDKQKKGIWHIDLRKVGGKVFSSGLASTKQNRKQLETEVIPLLLKKLKGEMTDSELKDRLISAKTATTVAVFGLDSLARHASNRQPHIQHAYELVFKKHILPTFGSKRLEDITGLDILDWQNSLNKKAGFATVKKARIMLMQMFDDGLLARIISTNPMLGTKLPKRLTEEREINPFGQQEIKTLLENASGYFRNVVGILIYSGMRPSELCALDWADVDFENKEIFIRQTIKRDRSVGSTKTKAAKRHIQMLPPVESFLKSQFLQTGQNGGRVFQSKIYKTGFTSIDYWQRAFGSLLQKCDLAYRNLYQCRHTFASMMLGNGEDLIWVSSMLGHKSPDITLKCYAKLIKTEHKERAAWLKDSHSFCYDFCYEGDSSIREAL